MRKIKFRKSRFKDNDYDNFRFVVDDWGKYYGDIKYIKKENSDYYKEYIFEPLYDCYTLDELSIIVDYMKGLSND